MPTRFGSWRVHPESVNDINFGVDSSIVNINGAGTNSLNFRSILNSSYKRISLLNEFVGKVTGTQEISFAARSELPNITGLNLLTDLHFPKISFTDPDTDLSPGIPILNSMVFTSATLSTILTPLLNSCTVSIAAIDAGDGVSSEVRDNFWFDSNSFVPAAGNVGVFINIAEQLTVQQIENLINTSSLVHVSVADSAHANYVFTDFVGSYYGTIKNNNFISLGLAFLWDGRHFDRDTGFVLELEGTETGSNVIQLRKGPIRTGLVLGKGPVVPFNNWTHLMVQVKYDQIKNMIIDCYQDNSSDVTSPTWSHIIGPIVVPKLEAVFSGKVALFVASQQDMYNVQLSYIKITTSLTDVSLIIGT